jgi:hypothetical protein
MEKDELCLSLGIYCKKKQEKNFLLALKSII